jgi:hypothetical protein
MRRLTFTFLAIFALSACAPASDPIAPTTQAVNAQTSAQVAKDYKRFTSMTPKPVDVDPAISMLCIGASQRVVADARKTNGPHAHTAITIYMNDPAANAFNAATTPYPVGAVIVKEKKPYLFRSADSKPKMIKANDGVGGMIKRPPGYDPDHGDWEYFYFEDPAKIESGKLTSCVQCHTGAAAKDYVFGAWANTP